MTVYVLENIVDVMNKFDEYKSETQSKWRKIETRGPLFLHSGAEAFDCIQHSTLRGASNTRFLNWAPLRTLRDHTPYVTIGRHIYACYFGPDPSRPKKMRKSLESQMQDLSEDEKKLLMEEKMSSWGSDNVICPAKVRIMYVIKFPTLKTHVHEKRKEMTHLFDEIMRSNPSSLIMKHTYVLELPDESSHTDHPCPDLSITSKNKTGDRAMNEAIELYTHRQSGISKVIVTMTNEFDDGTNGGIKEEFPAVSDNCELNGASVSHIDTIAEQIMNESNSMAVQNSRNLPVMEIAESSAISPRSSSQNSKKRKISDIDQDDLFLQSLIPQLKKLSPRKASEVKIEFMKILHKAQFDSKQ